MATKEVHLVWQLTAYILYEGPTNLSLRINYDSQKRTSTSGTSCSTSLVSRLVSV
jgi:hypothetical protein